MNQRKPRNFWTKENVLASSKQFENISEWRKQGGAAYGKAREMGWLEEATAHMNKNHDWTYEGVMLEASKYKTLTEWASEGKGSYSKAQKMGWLKDIAASFSRQIHPNGYWTKERVIEDAKHYKSRSDWRKNSSAASTMADRNGWFDEATSHMKLLVEHGKWTRNNILESAKKYLYRVDWQKDFPAAYGKALKNGWLEEVTAHMRQKSRTRKWTKDAVLSDAKKYESRGEWYKKSGHAAHAAKKKGWYEEATAHMHRVYSVGEMTIYKLLTQLDIEFEPQKRFDDIKDKKPLPFDFFLPQFNLVIEYQGLQHFQEVNRNGRESLYAIQKRDELKRQGALKNGINYISISATREIDIESEVARKLQELSKQLDVYFSEIKRPLSIAEQELLKTLGTWTKEQVIADARKYKSYPEWRRNSPAYQIAIKNGWLEECRGHMMSEFEVRSAAKAKWTKELVQSLATQFDSRSAFKQAYPAAYTRVRLNGWAEELFAHMKRKVHPNGYWTKEKVFESAKKFKTRTEWQNSEDKTAYSVARENEWIEDACKHMEVHPLWKKRLGKE